MIQKALVVTAGPTGERTPGLEALDEHLRAGWRVVEARPMGGGGAAEGFASLVVLERRGETDAEALLDTIEEEMDGDGDGAVEEVQDPVLRRLQDGDE